MKADFSRVTFDHAKHFSRVLLQQGRVTLDADPNEQTAILLHYVRTLARDLIGPWGRAENTDGSWGFQLKEPTDKDRSLAIGAGRYYVDGLLCENEADCDYRKQPDYPIGDDDDFGKWLLNPDAGRSFWLYLDVWERHVTPIEDGSLREVALGGPDTCTRAKVVWQVKARPRAREDGGTTAADPCKAMVQNLAPIGRARLAARVDPGETSMDPCIIAPDSRYRGAENQLYRIEIHRASGNGAPTFKWSRNNGSVATAWLGTDGNDLIVASGRGFEAGSWVELSGDSDDLLGRPGQLVRIAKVDGDRLTLDGKLTLRGADLTNPKVRAWDQRASDDVTLDDGAIPIVESGEDENWIDLEDGIQVRFAKDGTYRTGDYWQFSARVATGAIDWPEETDSSDGRRVAALRPPHGVEHHYAPLAEVAWDPRKEPDKRFVVTPCWCHITPIADCAPPAPPSPPTPVPPPGGGGGTRPPPGQPVPPVIEEGTTVAKAKRQK